MIEHQTVPVWDDETGEVFEGRIVPSLFAGSAEEAVRTELLKRVIPTTNDAVARMLTLSTALAGGAVALLTSDVCYGWWKVLAVFSFFTALCVSAFGSLPVDDAIPDETRHSVRDVLVRVGKRKGLFLKAATIAVTVGVLFASVGVAAKQLMTPTAAAVAP